MSLPVGPHAIDIGASGEIADLVIETPRGNLVEGMKWRLGTYISRFNRKRKLFGHLFSGRYKALPVDGSGTVGSKEFRQELLLQMTTLASPKFAGPEWRETGEKKAERIITEELNRRGWESQRLQQLRKADPEKLKIAQRLRAQTSVSLKWIAQHLSMGAPAYLGNCLRAVKRRKYANVRP